MSQRVCPEFNSVYPSLSRADLQERLGITEDIGRALRTLLSVLPAQPDAPGAPSRDDLITTAAVLLATIDAPPNDERSFHAWRVIVREAIGDLERVGDYHLDHALIRSQIKARIGDPPRFTGA